MQKEMKYAQIIEGKSKKIMVMDQDRCFMVFKPHLRSITSKREENIYDTDLERLHVNLMLMKLLENDGVKTHLEGNRIEELNGEQGVYIKRAKTIPLEFICRFYAAGSITRQFPTLVKEGEKFENMLLKFDYKQDVKVAGIDDPTMNESYIVGLKILNEKQLMTCIKLTQKVGKIISSILWQCNIKLIDMKMEFGFDSDNNIILIDEISQDCIRANDMETGIALTKDAFRKNESAESVLARYVEFRKRLEMYLKNRLNGI